MEESLSHSFKRAKRKQVAKILFISILTVLVMIPLMIIASDRLAAFHSDRLNEHLFLHNRIAEPNVQIDSQVLRNSTVIGGEVITNRSKEVAGYLIPWSTLTSTYSVIGGSVDYNEMIPGWQYSKVNGYEYDKQTKQKVASFYHPEVKTYYDGVKQELAMIEQLDNQVAEVALSFDQPYTWQEVSKQLPDTISVKWFYLFSEIKEESMGPSGMEKFGFANEGDMDEAYQQFIEDIESYDQNDDSVFKEFLAKEKGKKGDEAKILGVMVTGKTSELAKIKDLPFIRGSSIGVTAEIVPYITPESFDE
ncbi:anti sigma factor C-terminal domain-containing protein [Vagococcus sp. BWB3-3]|uniref:Anti sigma factor C-terminal domain-containing protein n=1 Tax=Vagococcus allomyrinae TaxID=2794353 RepID=A0A940PAK2_9ENTE|nr:anti sigma factor C-terminal domain-containing protein [Vagococcus allomyrinae]MBP1042646.1 anti sigma factor C-terminal domain-containing protein [Vagococcus allomyrinae]